MPTTERLVLRSWRPSDRAPFARLNADPDVVEFLNDGVPFTRPRATSCSTPSRLHWEQRGFGLWCAAAREDPDECLGFVGLAVPSFLPSVLPAVEVGWRLARPAWGRGLATEGARASLRHAFDELELEAVISIIDPDNARSIRVAEKLGHAPRRRVTCIRAPAGDCSPTRFPRRMRVFHTGLLDPCGAARIRSVQTRNRAAESEAQGLRGPPL